MAISTLYYGNHNVYEDEPGVILFHLNRMLGSAAKARKITSALPKDLSGKTIEVIGTESIGATRSFSDEFCNQLLNVRNASKVNFVDLPVGFMVYAETYAMKTGNLGRVSFVIKNYRY